MVDALKASAAEAKRDRGITYLAGDTAHFESYADLLRHARHVLGGLHRVGIKQGEALVMQVVELRELVHAIWGCFIGGISPVNISTPARYELQNAVFQKLLGVLDNLNSRHLLASPANLDPLRRLLPQTKEGKHTTVHDLAGLDTSSPAVHEPHIRSGDVLFYQLTSGSTGRSKCIPERHCAVISHLRHSIVHCGYSEADVSCNWLPFDHVVPMLTFHLQDVYLARRAVEISTADVLADPLLWVRAMARYSVSHSWAPNFGFKLVAAALEAEGAGGATRGVGILDLSALKRLMNAGEQVTTEVNAAFLRALRLDESVMQPAFGMAEVCTCMTYNNDYDSSKSFAIDKDSLTAPTLRLAVGGDGRAVMQFVDLGPPSPGVEIRIAKNGGSEQVDELQVGHLQIRAPCVMVGYHDNPSANAECYPGERNAPKLRQPYSLADPTPSPHESLPLARRRLV